MSETYKKRLRLAETLLILNFNIKNTVSRIYLKRTRLEVLSLPVAVTSCCSNATLKIQFCQSKS